MKFLFWNVRGFGNHEYRVALKNFCTSHKPYINFIAEPMISFDSVSNWFWSIIIAKVTTCANKIENHGHLLDNILWWDSTPPFIRDDFLRDRLGIPCFRITVLIG
jgi:hypothetical protein